MPEGVEERKCDSSMFISEVIGSRDLVLSELRLVEVTVLMLFSLVLFIGFGFFAEDKDGGVEEVIRLSFVGGRRFGSGLGRGLSFLPVFLPVLHVKCCLEGAYWKCTASVCPGWVLLRCRT